MRAGRTGESSAQSSSDDADPRQNPKSQKTRNTLVVTDPTEILEVLVGLKDVRVLHYRRDGPNVELMIEQIIDDVRCPSCSGPAQVKERPIVRYVDLSVYGTPMRF